MCSNLNSFGPQDGKCEGHTRLRMGWASIYITLPLVSLRPLSLCPLCAAVKATLLLFMFGLASLLPAVCVSTPSPTPSSTTSPSLRAQRNQVIMLTLGFLT